MITIYDLKNYKSIVRQIQIYEEELNITYINGVDTTKEVISSGKISKPTEDIALTLACAKEYKRLCEKRDSILKFIIHIKDDEIREMAIRYAFKGQSFENIGEIMNYDRKTISRKIHHVLKVAHNVP